MDAKKSSYEQLRKGQRAPWDFKFLAYRQAPPYNRWVFWKRVPGWENIVKPAAPFLAAVLLILLFFLLKAYGLKPAPSDENIYFYQSRLILEGYWPYRDFFFAHPPVHLFFSSAIFSIFGFSFLLAKWLPVICAAMGGLFLFLTVRRDWNVLAALVTLALYLFSYDLLRASSHYTGINLTVMFLAAALFALRGGFALAAGLLAALAALSGLYALPAVLLLALAAWLESPRDGLRYLTGFGAFFITVHLICLAYAGGAFLEQVYLYHLKKKTSGAHFDRAFRSVLYGNSLLFVGAWCAPLALAARLTGLTGEKPLERIGALLDLRTDRTRGLVLLSLAWTLSIYVLLLVSKRVFNFYFILMFPAMAFLTVFTFSTIAQAFLKGIAMFRRKQRPIIPLLVAAILIAVLSSGIRATATIYGSPPGKEGQVARKYNWSSASTGAFDKAVKALFWADFRKHGERVNPISRYLWHESRSFPVARRIARYLSAHSAPGAGIFGDSVTAPLVAILAKRRIAARFVDTNTQRFHTGMTSMDDCFKCLERGRADFIVLWKYHGIAVLRAFRQRLEAHYRLERVFRDPIHGVFLLYRVKQGFNRQEAGAKT